MKLLPRPWHLAIVNFSIFLLFMPTKVFAENTGGANDLGGQAKEQTLASNQHQLTALQLYTRNKKKPLAQLQTPNDYKVVANVGDWSIVRFTKPSVPIWVKEDFVELSGDSARVTAYSLKLRSQPNLESYYIGVAKKNYQSPMLARENGFVKILAPVHIEYSIDNKRVSQNSKKRPQIPTQKNRTSASSNSNNSEKEPPKKIQLPINKQELAQNTELSDTSLSERQHRLAAGDAISLTVFGESDLSAEGLRIPSGGRVSFPLIGSVSVVGKTTAQVEQEIAVLLGQGYVKSPRVSVTIFSYRPIFVRGAVNNIGAFPYAEGLTVANAIALAGGAKNSALEQGVSIVRDGVIIDDKLSSDSTNLIRSGDVIRVAAQQGVPDEQAFYVYLHGEVASPGEYKFRKGLTVEKAVVLAGGFTLRASRKKISITRYLDKDEAEEPDKLKRVKLYTPIQPGDVIDVGASWF